MDGTRGKRAFASLVDLAGIGELNSNAQSRVDARQLPKLFLILRVEVAGLPQSQTLSIQRKPLSFEDPSLVPGGPSLQRL